MVRFKNRYLLCEVIQGYVEEQFSEKQIANYLRDEVLVNFGELGLAKIYFSFQVKYWNHKTKLMVLRVPRDHANILTTTLALTRNFGTTNVKIRVLHSSGTIKCIERKALALIKKWLMKSATQKEFVNKTQIE